MRLLLSGFCLACFLLPLDTVLAEQRVRCESRDFRYEYCRVRTEGYVKLTKQTSDSPCIRGRTWGFDRNGIWVDQGCAGRFVVGYDRPERPGRPERPPIFGGPDLGDGGRGESFRCKSHDYAYNYCRKRIRGHVRLEKQLSDTPCIQGRTWGYDRRGVWVDDGCSGRFRVVRGDYGHDPRPVRRLITCESRNYNYRHCRTDSNGRVQLVQQLSDAPCVRGRTWGDDRNGIWVDNGCAARFEVTRRRRD